MAIEWLAAAAVSVVWLRPHLSEAFLCRTPIADRGVFIAIGKLIAEGAVPYRDVYDHKQPMIHLLGALAWSISPQVRSVLRLEQIALLVLAAVMFALLRHALGFRFVPALIGLSLGLVVLRNPQVFQGGHLTEEYGIIFLMAALSCGAATLQPSEQPGRQWAWAAGAGGCAALTLLTRESFLLALAALAFSLHIRLRHDRSRLWRRLGWEAAGFALPLLLWALYLWRAGAVEAYLEVFQDNWAYAGPVATVPLAAGLRVMEDIMFAGWPALAIAVAVAGLSAMVVAARAARRGSLGVTFPPFMLALWFAAELVAVSAPGRFYGHYYVAFVPIVAATFALIAEVLLPLHPRARAATVARLAVGTALVALSAWDMDRSYQGVASKPWALWGIPFTRALPDNVVERVRRDAAQLGWRSYVPLTSNGSGGLWMQMPLPLGTRFLYQFPWLFRSVDSLRVAELLDDLAETDLVVLDNSRPRLAPEIEREIHRALRRDFREYATADSYTLLARQRRPRITARVDHDL